MLRALALLFLLPAAAAQVAMPGAGGQRFVDFSQDLASPTTVVAIGALGKWKEGKRERLADGQLGGGGQVASVSGTQYFKVPVTATLQARAVLQGKADGVTLTFDLQVARLPDGKEKRQMPSGAAFEEDTLALFVFGKAKKGFELKQVIPIDRTIEKGSDAEPSFVDSMRDYYTVNRRMFDLGRAIADLDASKDDANRQKTVAAALRDLLAKKPELKKPQNDGLLTQFVAPLEQRAEKRLAEIAKAEKGDAGDKRDAGK